jgi:hypothetical protein
MADEPFFEDGVKVRAQNTFTVGLVYAFGTKFEVAGALQLRKGNLET